MTVDTWLSCEDPRPILEFLRGKASDRKFRLFQVACCYRIWSHLPDDDCRKAVLVAERFADGNARDRERRAIREQVAGIPSGTTDLTAINARGAVFQANEKTCGGKRAVLGAAAVVGHAANTTGEVGSAAYKTAYQAERKAETSLVRCIFGNPFRTATLDPACTTPPIVQLAQSIYDDRTFEQLPILADALEEAGCQDQAILEHLRSPGPHCRGCWPLDLVLGRA